MPAIPLHLATPEQSKYLINGNRHIVKLCKRIIASKKPLTVYFNQSREPFSSFLFELNPDGRSGFLDPLIPESGNRQLAAGLPASIQFNLDGIATWFAAGEVLRHGASGEHRWLEMALPTRAWYQQRRAAFRAQAFATAELTLKLYSRTRSEPIATQVQDLSVTGCRALVEAPPDQEIEDDESFYRCQLFQADREIISCGGLVRHVETMIGSDSLEFGLYFTQLTPQQDSVLSHLVMQLKTGLNQSQLIA